MLGTDWTCPGKGDRLDLLRIAMGLPVRPDDDSWITDLQLTGQPCGEYDARRLNHATLLPSPDPQEAPLPRAAAVTANLVNDPTLADILAAPLPRTAEGDMGQTLGHLSDEGELPTPEEAREALELDLMRQREVAELGHLQEEDER